MKRLQEEEEHVRGVHGNDPRSLDQFFTMPFVALKCVDTLKTLLKIEISEFDIVIEPSFGDGAFIDALKEHGVAEQRLLFCDIDARDILHRADFLRDSIVPKEYFSSDACCLTIGNPPFGTNSSLAISFFNHAAKFSACIAFILPRTFSKRSVHGRLDPSFLLAHEHVLDEHSFLFRGKSYDVPCVFQVWVHTNHIARLIGDNASLTARKTYKKVAETPDFKFVKPDENPDIAIRRIGVNAGRIFDTDVKTRSKQSHHFVRITDETRKAEIVSNLKALDLEHTEVKFQTAGNPSISKTELCQLYLDKTK